MTVKKKKNIVENTEKVEVSEDQASQNAASIKAKGKVDAMSQAITLLASMKGDEINQLLATLQQNSASAAASIPDGTAEKNAASVACKGAVSEELEEIFGGEELAEEFKEKISTLFEAAVNTRVQLEVASLEEQFEATLAEQSSTIIEELSENVDKYLSYVASEWMKKNEVAVETALRVEMAESFIMGLKNLFSEHMISVPEEKLDVLEAQSKEIDDLKTRLNEALNKNIELEKLAEDQGKNEAITKVAEGLALTQVEKFKNLVESLDFDGDLDKYTRKLNIIKEKHFPKKAVVSESADILTESFDGEEVKEQALDPIMSMYVQAAQKSVKK
jgi:hypothetical protein